MPYPRNYKSTSYMDDLTIMDLMNQILGLDAGDRLRIEFGGTGALTSTRYKLYAILNGLGRKEDFKLRKVNGLTLEVLSVIDENVVKTVNLVKREEQEHE